MAWPFVSARPGLEQLLKTNGTPERTLLMLAVASLVLPLLIFAIASKISYDRQVSDAKLLLERGAFPNPSVESSGSALWLTRNWRPDKRMEQLLLSHGARPDPERPSDDWSTAHNWLRISPLHRAARDGDVNKAKKLLDEGADLTARDDHIRSTPLAWAAKFGQVKMVEFLLKQGAAKSLPDDPPWATPRAWALKRGHERIAALL